MISRIFAAALGLLLASGAAWADSGPVRVEQAWARATPPHAEVGAVYMTLTAPSSDRLLSVSTPAAAKAEVHEMSMENGIMRMRETSGIVLSAGQPVVLGPGGYHVMLMGLKAPLKDGQTLSLHLTFASSRPVDVTATIRGTGASDNR